MSQAFDRDALLDAFDRIGAEAARHDTVLHVAVYGGSALILASNFRFSSEDVDIAELPEPKPAWLDRLIVDIAARNGWSRDWLNDAVTVHLSPLASRAQDHVDLGSFPREQASPGLVIYVPTAEYMLALKLKAARVLDPVKGKSEIADIRNLMNVVGIASGDGAVAVLAKYFPRSAADPAKLKFLLKHVIAREGPADAPEYPRRSD
jgi:hypothetical protein